MTNAVRDTGPSPRPPALSVASRGGIASDDRQAGGARRAGAATAQRIAAVGLGDEERIAGRCADSPYAQAAQREAQGGSRKEDHGAAPWAGEPYRVEVGQPVPVVPPDRCVFIVLGFLPGRAGVPPPCGTGRPLALALRLVRGQPRSGLTASTVLLSARLRSIRRPLNAHFSSGSLNNLPKGCDRFYGRAAVSEISYINIGLLPAWRRHTGAAATDAGRRENGKEDQPAINRRHVPGMLALAVTAAAGLPPAAAQQPAGDRAPVYSVYPVGWVRKAPHRTTIEIEERYVQAMRGLDELDSIWVLYWFDRNDTPEKRAILEVHPRGDPSNPLRGVFATRAPVRPNLIALSRCKVISVDGNVIVIDDIDALPDTPVLDIKPW